MLFAKLDSIAVVQIVVGLIIEMAILFGIFAMTANELVGRIATAVLLCVYGLWLGYVFARLKRRREAVENRGD